MAIRKKPNIEKARQRLKLRASIMEAQDKKRDFMEKEKNLRAQLRSLR